MLIDPAALSVEDRYKLLIGVIVPRPIAWVSTVAPDGRVNLAPFSFFNGVSSNPMAVVFCPANCTDGGEKDTLRNAKPVAEGGTGEFVINVVPERLAREMVACGAQLPYGDSEFDAAGLTPEPSHTVRPPRVRGAPVALECTTDRVVRLAPGKPSGGNLVIGLVRRIHAEEGVVNERFHVDPDRLSAIGRMGGPSYTLTRQRFDLPFGLPALQRDDPVAPFNARP